MGVLPREKVLSVTKVNNQIISTQILISKQVLNIVSDYLARYGRNEAGKETFHNILLYNMIVVLVKRCYLRQVILMAMLANSGGFED